ncbi:hypothetical protein DVA67_016210 [Solirubrobacter sp. CPCC 204708]|uniref:Uncharacterized protein n=1 Tax=Solirubrobacter deserti TaxID=2282478 RepID=A0ABT4RP53_9ACTN|nr:hypothetical protein [Solirubrobacter deserti]MBE2317528.1 hypothetical protein [Solirubrobacter deserti]MDA0140296.1 hypothetical protein [Solirubrobacter deserti]
MGTLDPRPSTDTTPEVERARPAETVEALPATLTPARAPAGPAELLAETDADSRAEVVGALQRTAGNARVTRMLAASRTVARTPSTASFRISEPRVGGGTYGSHAGFDVEVVGSEIVVTQKVRLVPDADVTPEELAATQTAAETAFVSLWDNRFILTDTASGEQLSMRLRVQFSASGGNNTVRLHKGQGRMDSGNWFTGAVSNPVRYAHELSHLMGLLDEYVDTTAVNRRTATSPGVHTDHSIMGDYPNEGVAAAEVKLRHGQKVADEAGRALSPRRVLTASFTGQAQGERLVRWRGIRDAAAPGTPERTQAAAEVTAIEADMLIPQLSATAGVPYTPTP